MLPVMGEFHFSRYPPQYWEDEILKMKAAGVNVIATYIFWIHHEEIEGEFDWTGQRDLRHFVELCSQTRHVCLCAPRSLGSRRKSQWWPAGLAAKKQPENVRTNDPDYLAHVARLYREIALQLRGLLWKDGGPVIGAQLENEYSLHGPG